MRWNPLSNTNINGNKKQIDPKTSECAQNTQKDKFPYKCKAHVAY